MAPMPDPLALLRALRHGWPLALGLGILSATLVGLAAWKIVPRPKYVASTVIEVKTQLPVLLNGPAPDRTDYKIFQSTQLMLVGSRLVLNTALARPEIAALESVRAQPDAAEWLEDQLVTEFQAGSEFMRLSLSGDRPHDLAMLVNAVAEVYLDEIVSKDHHERSSTSLKLKTLLDTYNAKLTKQRSQLKKLAETVGSDDKQTLAMKQQIAVQQLAQEQSELLKVQAELKRSKVELTVLQSGGDDAPALVDNREAVEDALSHVPLIEHLELQADELKGKIDRTRRLLRQGSDPSLRDLRLRHDKIMGTIAAKRNELRSKVEKQLREGSSDHRADRVAELDTQVKILTEYEKVLAQGISRLEIEAQSFNRQTIDLQWMKDEIAQGEEVARQLGRQMEALNVELKAPQRGRVVQPAGNPRVESGKKRLASIALALLGAFGCSVLGVSWREYRLRRVDSPEEVVEGLNLRLVGTLPALPGSSHRRKGIEGSRNADAARWQSLLIESVDAARTVLLRDCHAGNFRVVMITSATKGEGKSSLSSHLAISLARAGRRTVLVDCDLRSPSVHGLFDVPATPGVCELLRGEMDVEETACPVMSDLDVIPAGTRDAFAIRSLAHEALPTMIRRLKAEYDYVVIDSAPVLPVADSLLISQHVDAVVLSVYREVSRIPAVFAGYERLAALGVRVLGVVVTGLPAEHYGEAYHYVGAERA